MFGFPIRPHGKALRGSEAVGNAPVCDQAHRNMVVHHGVRLTCFLPTKEIIHADKKDCDAHMSTFREYPNYSTLLYTSGGRLINAR